MSTYIELIRQAANVTGNELDLVSAEEPFLSYYDSVEGVEIPNDAAETIPTMFDFEIVNRPFVWIDAASGEENIRNFENGVFKVEKDDGDWSEDLSRLDENIISLVEGEETRLRFIALDQDVSLFSDQVDVLPVYVKFDSTFEHDEQDVFTVGWFNTEVAPHVLKDKTTNVIFDANIENTTEIQPEFGHRIVSGIINNNNAYLDSNKVY
jgi:hypothetical protein